MEGCFCLADSGRASSRFLQISQKSSLYYRHRQGSSYSTNEIRKMCLNFLCHGEHLWIVICHTYFIHVIAVQVPLVNIS